MCPTKDGERMKKVVCIKLRGTRVEIAAVESRRGNTHELNYTPVHEYEFGDIASSILYTDLWGRRSCHSILIVTVVSV